MSEEFLPFSRPSISQAAIDEVVACLKSGWIATGPRVNQFTENLKRYFDAPHVLPLTSATAGLHVALLGMDLAPGDEVITTPLTFVATLNTIVLAGGKPVLIDIDPGTLNMDMNRLADAVTDRTRVIMPVHFAGLPVDLDPVYEIAEQRGLRVLEDAAHAIGAEYKGKRIGSFGDTQVFSFHPNKNMTTGEGGCVVTRDQQLAMQIERLRFHGIDRQAWNRYSKGGSQDYEVVLPGYKYNMMDIQAAIGIHQLQELGGFIARRNELANRYQEALSDWPQWTLPKRPPYEHLHAWHIYTPLINEEITGMNRDEFMQAMKEKNIGTGLHYRAAHLYPYYRQAFGFNLGDFPHAEDVCERIVSLPLFPGMTDAEHDKVLDVMYGIFN
ncbi:DegT/DnrJ/EryC1/StrS family aminotransferase [Aquicella lusitana]|uniref:dTDP-4-amino-4,6-dideoxygalactose transaminase n=1 Tax=Aquicella lusitana TaxID=254246 RepID=A0A370G3K6_9COXI|nr:DegT/DnrJ/EryC1/StrS family aminotransferase [Aquicella lusitana]RDI38457.1 dTDP-4-amino-4,6-dideoxygalactose transaminase [Aquicella lusitana]VVC73766.1 UDP-4-amino-4-deoxy-L-arabinose--oxoglutarate aminotransferase [Aquicella lusitana]